MPCHTDPPTNEELALARTQELVKEIRGKKFNHKNFSVFGSGDLQKNVRELCTWCKEWPGRIPSMSLELQMWWRDHQLEDQRHEREALERTQQRVIKAKALAKLTREERRALGVD